LRLRDPAAIKARLNGYVPEYAPQGE